MWGDLQGGSDDHWDGRQREESGLAGTETGGQPGMTSQTADTDEQRASDHLDDVEDGCGCAEIWEHLSERREADD